MKKVLIKLSFIAIILVIGAIIIASKWTASDLTLLEYTHDLQYDPPIHLTVQKDSMTPPVPLTSSVENNHIEESNLPQQHDTIEVQIPLPPQSDSTPHTIQAQSVNEDTEMQPIASAQKPQQSAGPNYAQLNRQIIDIADALERFNSKLIIKSDSSENPQ